MTVLHSHPLLARYGLTGLKNIFWQLNTPQLYEVSVLRHEGEVAHLGPLVVNTGQHTGRSPKDKFVVKEPSSAEHIHWGEVNKPFSQAGFERLFNKIRTYYKGRDIFVQNCYAGSDPNYRMPVTIMTEMAWHNWFVRNMFVQAEPHELDNFEPEFTVIQAPGLYADPELDGTRSGAFILVNMAQKMILIGGTMYTGEIKKGIFSVMNYKLPLRGVLTMHCSANEGPNGDVAVFFGLSGTGKTTLSSDASRKLIGDDEHAWTDTGIFNIEGGCYAKAINLSEEGEPEIYQTTRMFGTILENVVMDMKTRRVDFSDATFTQNTRISYPIPHIPNAKRDGMGGHPKNIIFLTADAFGVMPPVSKLTRPQAMYHFLSGYTAKVAGTEEGLGAEPQATFSTCFGEPFLPLNPKIYADLLGEKIDKHNVNVWLVNTGWTGGSYGVGQRMRLSYTRAMIHAILDGTLDHIERETEPFFGLQIPVHCPNVPDSVLNPRDTWADHEAYDRTARELAARFNANFETKYAAHVSSEIAAAGPLIS